MTHLPFLVEHGDLVWKLLAVMAAAAAIGLVRRIGARRERRATARELAMREIAMTAPVEGLATVRGTLRGGRASSVSLLYLRGRRPYYDERAAELWLDCEGQRVTLTGAVRVVRGTRLVSTRDRRSGLPEGESSVRSSPILHRLTAMAASVGDGDEVFVTARLAARPSEVAMSYREAATAWTAAPHGEAIDVVAVRPAVHAAPLGSMRTVVSALAGAAAMVAGLWGAGSAAMAWTAATERRMGDLAPAALGELDAVALAAATPGHRDEVLALFETRLATRTVRTAEMFELWRAVARLRGGCGGEIAARIAQDDIDGLAELAKQCKDDRAAAEAYQLLGMFPEAVARSKDLPATELPVESVIAVRAWWRAAEWAMARSRAATAQGGAAARQAPGLECAAEWWLRLGELNVDTWMARARFASRDPACAVLAMLSLPVADQAAALAALEGDDRRARGIAHALAWALGAPITPPELLPASSEMYAAMFEPRDRETVARALLSELAYQRIQPAPIRDEIVRDEMQRDTMRGGGMRAVVMWRAALAVLGESIGLAQAHAREVIEHWQLERLGAFYCDGGPKVPVGGQGRALRSAIALRFPTAVPWLSLRDDADDAEARQYFARTLQRELQRDRAACDRPELGDAGHLAVAVARAEHDGDARDLAALLARCQTGRAHVVEDAFAVWPRVHEGRAELAEVLRRLDLGPTPIDPLAVIGRAALRRDLARMIGDERTADAWAAVVDRHVTAFSQPMQLTVLVSRELLRAGER